MDADGLEIETAPARRELGVLATSRILRDTFGFPALRPGQDEVVAAVLSGADVLAVMPTGAGKSLCYQLPALVEGGLTLVVSPLIALMRDQVAQMRGFGVPAAALTSMNSHDENSATLAEAESGRLRLLYAAPERLASAGLAERLKRIGLTRLAVDEAHCVSQWGHDFRPDYLQLGELRRRLGAPPLLALTATADAMTRDDIAARLFSSEPLIFVHGFDRPNLNLAFAPKRSTPRQIADFIAARRGQSGIVYCSSRKRTERFAEALAAAGHEAVAYHAGLDPGVRQAAQDRFQRDDGVVAVATVAFGMGIDKPDVRFVAHADLPKSIESYYQEIGRAGRDGLPADTLTLFGMEDVRLRRQQIEESPAGEEQKRIEHGRLKALIALCEAPVCRRQTLLSYFGEASGPCGNCDLCQSGTAAEDATEAARKALSAIARTGERFGTEHLVSLLLGEATEAIRRFRHDQLPTFGVGAEIGKNDWRALFRQLYAAGHLHLDIEQYGRWVITESGREVLFGRAAFARRRDAALAPSRKERRAAAAVPDDVDNELLAALKALRRKLAGEARVPAYVVFPDRTLIAMAAERPTTLVALGGVHGVGARKLAAYGDAFLAVLSGARAET
ncbi:MAG: DNA helicase RecQ [Rhizobiales bacterium]|nr:DNA helicase RecQ [Hyphomicrobiales bacterium]